MRADRRSNIVKNRPSNICKVDIVRQLVGGQIALHQLRIVIQHLFEAGMQMDRSENVTMG